MSRSGIEMSICLSNIGRFRSMLRNAATPDNRRILAKLLAEEEAKLRGLSKTQQYRERLARMISGDVIQSVLESLLTDSIAIMFAAKGNVQLVDPATGDLRIVASRGFSEIFLNFFSTVNDDGNSACSRAMAGTDGTMVEDVALCDLFHGKESGRVMLEEGCLAVQSMPLFGPSGHLVGMVSTHWRSVTPRNPDRQAELRRRIGQTMNDLGRICGHG